MSDFTYDLSWPVDAKFDGRGQMYLYTSDYKSTEPCPVSEELCSKMSYPGLWEIPNINLMNKHQSTPSVMMDGCDPGGNATGARYWLETSIITMTQTGHPPLCTPVIS